MAPSGARGSPPRWAARRRARLEERRGTGDFVKVLDFGIAKVRTTDRSEDNLTMVGAVCGTPEYMAPEQARGDKDLDPRADIYALGVILYELVVGKLPFRGDSALAVLTKQLSEEPQAPKLANPEAEIPPAIDAFVLRCLAKDRADRPATSLAFVEDIMAAAAASNYPEISTLQMPAMNKNALQENPIDTLESPVAHVVDDDADDTIRHLRAVEDSVPEGATDPVRPFNPTSMAGEVIEDTTTHQVIVPVGRTTIAVAAVASLLVTGLGVWLINTQDHPLTATTQFTGPEAAHAPGSSTQVRPPTGEETSPRNESTVEQADRPRVARLGKTTKKKGKRRSKKAGKKSKGEKKTAKGLYRQAHDHFIAGRCKAAVPLFRKAIAAGLKDPEVHYDLGRCFTRLSQPRKARTHFEAYLQGNPASAKRRLVEAMLQASSKEGRR